MKSGKLIAFILFLYLVVVLLAGPALSVPDSVSSQSPPVSGAASSLAQPVVITGTDLQRQVISLLSAEDIAGAEKFLGDSLNLSADRKLQLSTYLGGYQEFLSQRHIRREEATQKQVAKAKEYIQQDKLEQALACAYLAVQASSQPQQIRDAEWLSQIVERCAQKAQELSEQGEYAKATVILREISLIFEQDQKWKERFEQTGLHAGVLGAYDEKSGWQERLRDAESTDFETAIQIVDKYYVKPAGHRKMLLGALNGLRSFLTTRGLEKAFPSLADKEAVAALTDFIDTKIQSVQEALGVTAADIIRTYWQIILKNRQGLRLPDAILVDLMINQACQAIDDYTEMIWPDQQKWFARTTTGSFTGIGVQIRINQAKQLEIVTPLVGTPAFKAGLQASDLIVAVDGKSTEGISVDEAVRKITGEKETVVNLTIRRPGLPEEFTIPVVRDVISIDSILGYKRTADNGWNYILDDTDKIAYVRISNFTNNTAQELERAIGVCRQQGAKALIVDLRFNPGGTLKAAEEVSDFFLPAEQVIVSTKGQWVKPYVAKATGPDNCKGWPVVVLTCDKSASASEIVAGALQDYGRAVIVGQRTFGKGLVQRSIRLRGFSDSEVAIKVTTAYWYLPKGRNVQRSDDSETWGVEPDLKVDLTPEEFRSLRNRWMNAEIIRGPKETPAEPPKSAPEVTPPSDTKPEAAPQVPDESGQLDLTEGELQGEPLDLPDPQLETALLMARLQLLLDRN